MNKKDQEELEEMFLKDSALRNFKYDVKHDPAANRMHQTILKYGLSENQAMLLMLDLIEAQRSK
jgi:hypothetical protein